MKFAHSLKFNAVPEWQDNYVNYTGLKKQIYKLQQDQLAVPQPNDGSYDLQAVNPTTVSELVESYKYNKKKAAKASKDEEEAVEGTSRFRSKVMRKFKKNQEDNFDEVSSTPTPTPDEKQSSVEFQTLDVENSTIVSFGDDGDETDAESQGDYSNPESSEFDPLKVFAKQLLIELQRITDFYNSKEKDLLTEYDNLMQDLRAQNVHIDEVFKFTQAYNYENPEIVAYDEHHQYNVKSTLSRTTTNASVFDHINHVNNDYDKDLEKQDYKVAEDEDEEDDDDDDDDDEDDYNQQATALLTHTDFNVKQQVKITLKRKSGALFIALSELKSFIELNRIGFTKICKKFDKTCNYSIKADFIDNYLPAHSRVFLPETIKKLDYSLDELVKVFAFLSGNLGAKTTKEDLEYVRAELKSRLRDHIVWERNTVWKDLLSLEKRSYNLNVDPNQSKKMGDELAHDSMLHLRMRTFQIGKFNIKVPASIIRWQIVKLLVTIVVFVILLTVKTFNDPEQARCLAVLVAAAMLWASEALPLYVTAMLVPLLVVTCKVLKNSDGTQMEAAAASQYILAAMWSSVIMILIGGFTLAAALSKYNVAKVLSSFILAFAGTKPRNVLLSIMGVSLFLAMWISNVAAPVLCYSLIQPVLRTLPTDSPMAQALVLGIALASNVAGMASPIASPQNVIAIESMNPNPGWGKWFAVALPVSIIAMLGIWLELLLTFRISKVKIKAFKPIKERFTSKQIYVSIVTVTTIILWCVMTQIESTFGEAGIISIVPIVLFFGTGLLKADDLNNFPWSIVWLAMGGLALGKAVTSSGLLATIAKALQKKIMDFNVFVILIIFGALILVVATFVSHTVAALIIIPLVKEVGETLPTPHPLILVMGAALISSSAMGLPTSGFPNVTAISMTDEVGKPYLTVNTFITRGVPASIIAYVVVVTLGYGIMNALHF